MAAVTSVPESTRRILSISEADDQSRSPNHMPLVSILLPAFNEAMIIEENLTRLCRHMESLETQYRWEIIVVNDGSRDETGALAEQFSKSNSNIHVFHHVKNYGLGQALNRASISAGAIISSCWTWTSAIPRITSKNSSPGSGKHGPKS